MRQRSCRPTGDSRRMQGGTMPAGSAAARNDADTDEGDAMPIVHIEILEGRPASKKRALISEVTDAVVRSLEVQPAQVRVLLRDFVTATLREQPQLVEALAGGVATETGTQVEFEVKEQYRNMREVLDRHPEVVERARVAIRRAGLTPI